MVTDVDGAHIGIECHYLTSTIIQSNGALSNVVAIFPIFSPKSQQPSLLRSILQIHIALAKFLAIPQILSPESSQGIIAKPDVPIDPVVDKFLARCH
jgi:hypothetical protein